MTGLYKMRTVCERSGFNQALLRAWERRYDLLQPERTDGGHRLYTEDDLLVLARIREMLEDGRTIGEIASLGRANLLSTAARGGAHPGGNGDRDGAVPAGAGGRAAVADQVERLARAAAHVQEPEVEACLDQAFATLSPQAALDTVVFPAMAEVGHSWSEGRCSTAGQHLLASKVVGRLHGLLRTANPINTNARHAVCACLPDDEHEIGALSCAYTLARHGCRITYLGAGLPFTDIEHTCDQLRPELLTLSTARTALLERHRQRLIELIGRLPGGVRLLIGGAGVHSADPALAAAGAVLIHPGGPHLTELLA